MYHKPVMLDESLENLCIKESGIYVDLTFGGGGHSSGILKFLSKSSRKLKALYHSIHLATVKFSFSEEATKI